MIDAAARWRRRCCRECVSPQAAAGARVF